jgi:hypothetical protein
MLAIVDVLERDRDDAWTSAAVHRLPRLDPPAAERVQAPPAPRDVEQLEMTDADGERRVDDQVLADGLEAEHRPQ